MVSRISFTACVLLLATSFTSANEQPTRQQTLDALNLACAFFAEEVAQHGGYVWVVSSDLRYRQGEGLAYDQRIWVQPPGTPAVGLAMLEAYRVTGNEKQLLAARAAADALVKGQLHAGGWSYSITFDLDQRMQVNYRIEPSAGAPNVKVDPGEPGGWDVWRQRRYKGNKVMLDDNTTQAALRLLMQIDQVDEFDNATIHEAVQYGLKSVLAAQYPVGAWSHNYDRFPRSTPDAKHYPVIAASYPEDWSRTWTKKFAGCYMINDRITLDVIDVMLQAYRIYGDARFLESAKRGGQFLLLAQMPDPQPGWCQAYDRHMQPVWDRPFEPPAITGSESQEVMTTLLNLYRQTSDKRYLQAVGKALPYYRRSLLTDGQLARFYELKTNRPIFFNKNYEITYHRGEMPSHYQFLRRSRLDQIAAEYKSLVEHGPNAERKSASRSALAAKARTVIDQLDRRGAWTEEGCVRDPQGKKVVPADGVISSKTFIDNVQILSRLLATR